MSRVMRAAAIGAGMVLAVMGAVAQNLEPMEKPFIIESQPLPKAVNVWADQAGMQVLWSSNATDTAKIAPKVQGRYTPKIALRLLLKGSGLTYILLDGETVSIRPDSSATATTT